MKKNMINLATIIILILFTVAVNVFSDFALTADGIKGLNSITKILISFIFVLIWIFGSFYQSFKKEQKIIMFLSLIYLLIFVGSFIYNGIFLIFSFIIAPLLPILELFNLIGMFESGKILYISFCLLAFFLINIGAAVIGASIHKRLIDL